MRSLVTAAAIVLVASAARPALVAAQPPARAADRPPLAASLLGIGVETHRGYLRVSEVLQLHHAGTRAFAGEVAIPLPRGARFVTFHEGLVEPRVEGDRIIDRMTVQPGAHRVAYAYSIAGAGDVVLDRQVLAPIERIEVLATAPAGVRSALLAEAPSFEAGGRRYVRASGRASAPGILPLIITGVPHDRRWPAPAAAAMMATILVIGLARSARRAGVGLTGQNPFHRSQ